MKGNFMNRSKLIGATALASVMAAGAAQAEMSISGLYAGTLTDSDGGGLSHSFSTNSVYVSYSDSMDNGMGVSVSMSLTAAGLLTDVNIDTGMGTIGLGNGQDSAVDKMDGSPACFSLNACGAALNANYIDGDSLSGNSVMYTSPSINGFTVKVSRGMEVDSTASTVTMCGDMTLPAPALNVTAIDAGMACPTGMTALNGAAATEGNDEVMSYAIKGSIMGATVGAGLSQIDYKGTSADVDPSFVTVGYSIAGLNLGYALYDGDNGGEETQMGVGTSAMGMNVGVTFASADLATDVDYTRISLSKGMGAASFGIDYTETDVSGGTASDTEEWNFMYVVGF
jgi:hypothetical protein